MVYNLDKLFGHISLVD